MASIGTSDNHVGRSLNATSRDFHGFTKDMSFARLVLSASSLDRMPRIYDSGLAPRHAIIPLVDHYLDNIYVLYPFFSEIKLFASLDVLYQEDGRNADAIDHWHVRMVLAIALASRSRRRDDEDYREAISHAAAAFNRAETVIQPGSLVGIQAILLLVLYSIFDPYHFSSWYLIGVASRVMVDLGLHQDSADPSLMKDSQVQMRHRIYHSVYTLDRFGKLPKFRSLGLAYPSSRMISMTHLKAFSFTDDSTNVASSFTDDSNNVAFRWDPRPYSVTWNGLHEQHQLFLRQLHPAMQILQLRQMQSSVYQLNFQTRNRSDHDTWPSVVNFLEKTQLWAEKIPNVIQRPMKQLLRSEVMYGCIIALSPPGFTHINAYGTALLFTYTVEYASIMSTVDGDLKHFAFCTFNDILRASHVADRFLSVIAENSWSTLLHEGMPKSCSMSLHSGFVTPPSLPPWSVIDVLDKAVMCLKMLERTLDNLGQRFDKPGPLKEYKIKSKGVRFMLDSRREQWSRTDRQHTT